MTGLNLGNLSPDERLVLGQSLPQLTATPSPKQLSFLQSRHPRRLLRSGNRSGKSYAGALEAWGHALGWSPWKGRTIKTPNVGLIVAADWRSQVDVVSKIMYETCPHPFLAPGCDYNVSRGWMNQQISLSNGSVILFRSALSKSTSLAGLECSWLWIDEPPTRSAFGEALARVAVQMGPAWLTMTPIGRPVDWLKLHVEGDPEAGIQPSEDWEQYVIRLTTEDCPHRSQESLDAQIGSYLPMELPQRRDGAWEGVVVDRLLDAFDDSCVSEPPLGQYHCGLGMDHGEQAGKQVALLVIWSSSSIWVIDEYRSPHTTTPEEDATFIKEMASRNSIDMSSIDRIVGDTNIKVNSIYSDLLGHPVKNASKKPGSVLYGSRLLNYAFKNGKLHIHPRCRNLIQALKTWDGSTTDRAKDPIDALRYIAVPLLERGLNRVEQSRLRLR